MIIDKGKLIALLVEKTEDDKEAVRKKLDELIDRIRESVEANRQFHIEHFGTFTMLDGLLHFEPAGQLKTELNQKYTGMKPIELMEAFKETGAGIPVEETGRDDASPKPAEVGQIRDKPDPDDGEQEEEKTKETTESEPSEEPEKAPPVPVTGQVADKKDELSAESEAGPQAAERKKPKMEYGRNRNSNSGTVIFLIIIVIAVIAGAWLLYSSGILGSLENKTDSGAAVIDTTAQSTEYNADTLGATATFDDSMEQNTADSVSQSNRNGSEPASAVYGLKGEVNEEVENAYTIVIHSFRLRSTVQEIADSLNQRGYRTVLFDGPSTTGARWRLGLGQFQSTENAQQAVSRLSDPYRENHFITRIQ